MKIFLNFCVVFESLGMTKSEEPVSCHSNEETLNLVSSCKQSIGSSNGSASGSATEGENIDKVSTSSRENSPTTISINVDVSTNNSSSTNSLSMASPLTACLPTYGYKVPLNQVFPKNWNPYFKPTLAQIIPLIPVGLR